MQFLAVSTFNKEGLEIYGHRMVESFRGHWPAEVPMRVYSEGWDDELPGADRVDLEESSLWLTDFKVRHHKRKPQNYRMDAVRFSHKIAALTAADNRTNAEFLIWLDGDIFTHADLSIQDLRTLTPSPNEWISWLDRSRAYPECGFYIINRAHPRNSEMMSRLVRMYSQDQLFSMSEWHDSYVLQQLVLRSGVKAKSLSGDGFNTMHPLINGPLGQWMDHLKGPRKRQGKSASRDLKVKRGEVYWR